MRRCDANDCKDEAFWECPYRFGARAGDKYTVYCTDHKYKCVHTAVRITEIPPVVNIQSGDVKMIGKAATSGVARHRLWRVAALPLMEGIDRRMEKADNKPDGGYAIHNWKEGLDDVTFLRDRVGHTLVHLLRLMGGSVDGDDSVQGNSDALSWGAMFIAETVANHKEAWEKAFYAEPRGEKGGVK